jgi:HEPN domain-containing protein
MNRDDFKRLAEIRVREARTLLDAGHYPGAYYLIGYAVECALKACVSKQIKRYDFPDKKFANAAYTHELKDLVGVAGLSRDLERDRVANSNLDANWLVVKDWNESFRYDLGITRQRAFGLYSACTGRNGVLQWIRRRW